MVYITHSGDNIEKQEAILIAAQKRFGLYGLEKTTMKEIASDLGISKAALYYYFQDKECLFKAVVEMEQAEFFKAVQEAYTVTPSPADMLKEYHKIRVLHFKTLFNLSRLRYEEFRHIKPLLNDTLNGFKQKEEAFIKGLIASGVEKGLFYVSDPAEMATIFVEVLKGLRIQVTHKKELLYIEPQEYAILEKKLDLFTDVFIRGLTNHHINT